MKWCIATGAVIGLSSVLLASPIRAQESPRTWTFDTDTVEKPPAGFIVGRTGQGTPGRWIVRAAKDAPSDGQVLAQVDGEPTDYRFPVAVAESPSLQNLHVAVKCKPVSGKVDQACGLVFRYQDENNYYLTRANALEDNVNLYYVKDGHRKQIKGWKGKVTGQAWHELAVEADGDRLAVSFDGSKVIEAKDTTFTQRGKVGVWTKADSITEFDDLNVSAIRAE